MSINSLLDSINATLAQANLTPELEQKFRTLMQGVLRRLDLVTREEFDAQAKVLQHSREKIDNLEQELTRLEAMIAAEAEKEKDNKQA